MSSWIEKKTILNCKQVRFDHNNNIYYLTKNNIYGENLNDKKIFFTMYFEEEVKDFKITKNRLIVILDKVSKEVNESLNSFRSLVKIFDLFDKKEIVCIDFFPNFNIKINVSYNTDDVLIGKKKIINSEGKVQEYEFNEDMYFKPNRINNYLIFGNIVFDKVEKVTFDHNNDYHKVINDQKIRIKKGDHSDLEDMITKINVFNSNGNNYYVIREFLNYSEKYTIKNNIIYYLDGYKLYTINLNQKQRRYDIEEDEEDQFGVVTNVEIPFNDQDYDSVDISVNGNFIIYKHFNEDTFKIFSKEKKEESSFEKIGKLFFKKNLFTEDLISIIDDNNQEKSYNKDILEILFPIIKISLEETQSKKFTLTGFTIEDFDELIDELIESKEISNKELFQFLG